MRFVFQELKNPTDRDLIFMWDSIEYKVLAGKSDIFPDFIAKHGAKKLADREWTDTLNKNGRIAMENSFLGAVQNEKTEEKQPTLQEEIAEEKQLLKKEEKEFEELEEKVEFDIIVEEEIKAPKKKAKKKSKK